MRRGVARADRTRRLPPTKQLEPRSSIASSYSSLLRHGIRGPSYRHVFTVAAMIQIMQIDKPVGQCRTGIWLVHQALQVVSIAHLQTMARPVASHRRMDPEVNGFVCGRFAVHNREVQTVVHRTDL